MDATWVGRCYRHFAESCPSLDCFDDLGGFLGSLQEPYATSSIGVTEVRVDKSKQKLWYEGHSQ